MRNFNRGGKSSRGGSFNTRGFGSRDSGRTAMYQATCAECGKECEVPFKPSGDKPVFCSSCFENKRGRNEDSRRSGGRSSGRFSFEEKRMFTATCAECGKKCEVPFRPTEGKPIYCNDCFEKKGGKKSKGGDNQRFNKQFDTLNKKLDQILQVLIPSSARKPAPKEDVVKAEKPVKDKSASNGKTAKKAAVKKTTTKKANK